MANKLSILLLLTAVAGSSLAQNTTSSCLPVTTIGSDLATFKFGEEMTSYGYKRVVQVLFDELLAILAEKAAGRHYNPNSEYAKLRAELAENRTWTGFLLGTNPTLDVMRLVNNTLDIATDSQLTSVAFRSLCANLVLAIKKAQGHDYEKSKAEITNILATVRTDLANVSGILRAAEHPNPPQALSRVDENVIECLAATATANVDTAFTYIFKGIYLLVDALHDPNVKNNVEKYVSQLLAFRKKAAEHFVAEVKIGFTIKRNRRILSYLRNAPGTYATLLELEAPYDDYTTV